MNKIENGSNNTSPTNLTENKPDGLINSSVVQNDLGLVESRLNKTPDKTIDLAKKIIDMGKRCLLGGDGRMDRDC